MNKFNVPELDLDFFDAEPAGAGYPAPLCPCCSEPLILPGQHQVHAPECLNGCLLEEE